MKLTVIFQADLRHIVSGHKCNHHEATAIQEIQKSIENDAVIGSTFRSNIETACVIPLPSKAQVLADMIYWCRHAHIPYKTLWLQDASDWVNGT